jgi:hypothetical protein
MRSIRRAQARLPDRRRGCPAMVSSGLAGRPRHSPSNPATATSSGTRTPARANASSRPAATWSLAHTMASGS